MQDTIKPDQIISIDRDLTKIVSNKFDQLSSFSKLGALSFFDWMETSLVEDTEPKAALYVPLGSKEYDIVRLSNHSRFGKPIASPYFYAYTSFTYAECLAKLYSGKNGTAFVLKCETKKSYMDRYEDHGVIGGKGYFVPVSSMDEFNANIIGGIVVAGTFVSKGVL